MRSCADGAAPWRASHRYQPATESYGRPRGGHHHGGHHLDDVSRMRRSSTVLTTVIDEEEADPLWSTASRARTAGSRWHPPITHAGDGVDRGHSGSTRHLDGQPRRASGGAQLLGFVVSAVSTRDARSLGHPQRARQQGDAHRRRRIRQPRRRDQLPSRRGGRLSCGIRWQRERGACLRPTGNPDHLLHLSRP
jgi:hypothetical protein